MTDRQVLHFLVAQLDARRVVVPGQVGVHPQPGLGGGGAEVVDERLVVGKRLDYPDLVQYR